MQFLLNNGTVPNTIHTIQRSALGRIANIGDVYDAISDEFPGISILPGNIHPSLLLNTTDSAFFKIDVLEKDILKDKFSKLHVSPELQLSILTMPIDVRGTGSFLVENEISSRKAKCSLLYSRQTKQEQLNISHPDLNFSLPSEKEISGTHVVVGISWGANCILSCTLDAENDDQCKEMQASLLTKMRDFCSDSDNENVQVETQLKDMLSYAQIKLYSDLASEHSESPRNIKDSFQFLTHFVDHVKNSPKQALEYYMAPISQVCKLNDENLFTDLTPSLVARVVGIFDQMSEVHSKINVYYQDLRTFWYSVTETHTSEIYHLQMNLLEEKKRLREDFSQIIRSIRSGTQKEQDLETAINQYYTGIHSPENLENMMESWILIKDKLEFARKLKTTGVVYIGHKEDLDIHIVKAQERTLFVLYFSQNSKIQDRSEWEQTCHLFDNRIRTRRDTHVFVAVDCDVHTGLMPDQKYACMQIYKSGKVLISDILAYRNQGSDVPWVQILSEPQKVDSEPKKRGPLRIICPCQNNDGALGMDWYCTLCYDDLEYGYDGFIYCRCGKTPFIDTEFKCPSNKHQNLFQRHNESDLLTYLNDIPPFQETNLLILGETGVGKSTWINSVINFLKYDSLPQAESGGLISLVPTLFTLHINNESIQVCTGYDPNENFKIGASATQNTRIYSFRIGGNIIRLIDTPGTGDTEGDIRDQENFENVFQALTHLNELHGVCILLKPNQQRLTHGFRYCMKQLFSNLHRDAIKNIVFCFSNSRSTLYTPGDTMPVLQEFLADLDITEIVFKPETVYCFDSEAYRFLAAVTNRDPVSFPSNVRPTFIESWEKSISETKRLLRCIKMLPPHPVSDMRSIFQARSLVWKLNRPLTDVSRNILLNQGLLKQEIAAINKAKLDIKELEKLQLTRRAEIENRPLDYPKLVCTNSKCVRIHNVDGIQLTEYVTVCHAHCKLQVQERDIIGNKRITKCKAFYGTNGRECSECKHSHEDHLFTYFDSTQVVKLKEHQKVTKALQENLSAEQLKECMLNERKDTIASYADEQKLIEGASVKFAYFLKQNAITPYNDEVETYLNHLIKEETIKVEMKADPQVLNSLQAKLKSYIEHKQMLEKAKDDGGGLNPEDIQLLVDKLKKLPLSGACIESTLESLDKIRNDMHQRHVHQSEKYIKIKGKDFMEWIAE